MLSGSIVEISSYKRTTLRRIKFTFIKPFCVVSILILE